MTTIKLERRPFPGWLPIAALALLAGALFCWWVWRSLHANEIIGLAVPDRYRDLAVAYDGRIWVPTKVDRLTLFPDHQMTKVGAVEGLALYANPEHGMGGGGGGVEPPPALKTQPWGRIYVQVGPGRYLPLRWRASEGPWPR